MLIVASVLGCLSPALTVAACAAYKDPFVLPAERRAEADASRLRFAGESRSDHLARVAAFDGWRDAKRRGGAGAGYAFCRDRFLSPATLELAADMRRQFGKLLRDAGFLAEEKEGGESIFVGGEASSAGESSDVYSGKYDERAFASALDDPRAPHNANASDARVMRAAICAGMYPRVVSIRRKGRGGARAVFETIEDGAVDLHPGSVNARYGLRFPHDWLAYGEKVKTEKVYVRDSTCVPAVALLLFGGPLEIEGAEGEEEADDDSVNGDSVTNGGDSVNNGGVVKVLRGAYAFNADRRTLDLVRRLRDALDDVLRAKIERPRDERVGERGRWLARAVSALVADEEREREREREAASAAVRANGGGRFDDERSSRRGGGHSFFSRGAPGGSTREGPGAGARGGTGRVLAGAASCSRASRGASGAGSRGRRGRGGEGREERGRRWFWMVVQQLMEIDTRRTIIFRDERQVCCRRSSINFSAREYGDAQMMRTLRLLARSRPADGALARVSPLTPPGLPPSGVTPPSVSAAGASSSSASSRSRSAGAGAGSRGGGERAGGRGVGKGAARGGARGDESSIKPHARRGGAEGAVEPPREDGSRARRGGTGVDARVRSRARASRVRSRSRGGGGGGDGSGGRAPRARCARCPRRFRSA